MAENLQELIVYINKYLSYVGLSDNSENYKNTRFLRYFFLGGLIIMSFSLMFTVAQSQNISDIAENTAYFIIFSVLCAECLVFIANRPIRFEMYQLLEQLQNGSNVKSIHYSNAIKLCRNVVKYSSVPSVFAVTGQFIMCIFKRELVINVVLPYEIYEKNVSFYPTHLVVYVMAIQSCFAIGAVGMSGPVMMVLSRAHIQDLCDRIRNIGEDPKRNNTLNESVYEMQLVQCIRTHKTCIR